MYLYLMTQCAVINVVNKDQKCFKYAILSKYVKSDKPQRITHHYEELENRFNFKGLKIPMPLSDVKIFEKKNPEVSINVYEVVKCINTYKNKLKHSEKNKKLNIWLYHIKCVTWNLIIILIYF